MKKILRNVLVLALGLTTTIATAQIGASNTTWIDNTDSDARDGNSQGVTNNLKKAFAGESDYDLKSKVVNDVEFLNYSDAVKAAMN